MANTITINVQAINDTDKAFNKMNENLGKALKNMAVLAAAAGPQVFGPIIAGIGATAAAFASAGIASAAFGAAVVPQLSAVKKASEGYTKVITAQDKATRMAADAHALASKGGKEYTAALSKAKSANLAAKDAQDAYNQSLGHMPKATRDTAMAFANLKDSFQKWSDALAPKTMPIFTRGLVAIKSLLPSLTPLVETASHAFSGMMTGIEKGIKGNAFKSFMTDMNIAARTILPDMLKSLGNLGAGFAGVLQAFLPMSVKMSSGLENLTAKFKAWGQSLRTTSGFAEFSANAATSFHGLMDLFHSLVETAMKLSVAFEPISRVVLEVAVGIGRMVNAIPQGVWDFVVPMVMGIVVAMRLLAATAAIVNIAMIALSANPMTLMVAGLAAATAAAVVLVAKLTNTGGAKTSMADIAASADAVAAANEKAADSTGHFTDALLNLSNQTIGLSGSEIGYRTALRETNKVREQGTKVTDKELTALNAFATASFARLSALEKTGHNTAAAMHESRKAFIDQAVGMGYTKMAAIALATQYGFLANATQDIPDDVKTTLHANLDYWTSKLNKAKAELKSVPNSKKAEVRAEIAQAEKNIANIKEDLAKIKGKTVNVAARTAEAVRNVSLLQSYINAVHGKSVTITTYNRMVNEGKAPAYQHYAHGGIVGSAAGGGPRSNTTLVGEHGPELVDLAPGSMVHSAGDSARLARASGSYPPRGLLLENASGSYGSGGGNTAALALKQLMDAIDGKITAIRSKFNAVIAVIKKNFDGNQEDALVAYAKRSLAHLEDLAKKRDKVAAKLADSRKYASDLAKSSADFAKLTSLNSAQSPMGIKIGLEQSLSKMRQFASALKALAKRGLSHALFQQIAEAGPDAGLELAQNFLAMDPGMFKDVNKIQSQISKAANAIGSNTAEYLFGTKSLQKLEDSIQRAMDKAADKFADKIAAALGKHSKHKKHGKASGGPAGGGTLVGEDGPEWVDLPYGSSVMTAGDTRRRMNSGSGSSSAPIHIHLDIDGKTMAEVIFDPLRGVIRSISGSGPNSVQTALS